MNITRLQRRLKLGRGSIHAKSVTFEELLRACLYEQEALRRVLVRKGLLTNEEVLEEVKAVRRELEGKRGR